MTEHIESTPNPETPQPVPTMTPQQAQVVITALLGQFNQAYMEFINKIVNFPSFKPMVHEAFRQFDIGSCIFERAVRNMPLALPPAPQQQAPEKSAQAKEEVKASETDQATLDNA